MRVSVPDLAFTEDTDGSLLTVHHRTQLGLVESIELRSCKVRSFLVVFETGAVFLLRVDETSWYLAFG